MKQRHAPRGVPLFFVLCVCCLGSCAASPDATQPGAQLWNRDIDSARRVRMLDRITPGAEDKPTVAAMRRVVWSDRQALTLRVLCMDRLIQRDAATFWASAATHLVSVDSVEMLEAICQRAADSRRVDMIGPLTRSFARTARTIPLHDRPEAKALVGLSDDHQLEPVLWSVLLGHEPAYALNEQAAAWSVLCGLVGVEDATARLTARPMPPNAMGLPAILIQHRRVLTPLPSSREELLWLIHLHRRQSPVLTITIGQADHAADHPLALRHLPALQHAIPERRQRHVASLRSGLAKRLSGRPTHARGLDTEDAVAVSPIAEHFTDHAEALTYGDLVALHVVLDVLERPAVVAALFHQADADLADTATEHGGALLWGRGVIKAQPFSPILKTNDHAFISPHTLIEAMYTGLAHYHFHAQKHDNAAYAGPGPGDLVFAERMGFNCLVLTFVDTDTLAVDYYQPDGIVIDLGVIRRP